MQPIKSIFIKKNQFFFFSLIGLLLAGLFGCKSTYIQDVREGDVEQEGWVDENTYQIVYKTEWDSEKNYIAEIDEARKDKKALSMKELRSSQQNKVKSSIKSIFKQQIYQVLEDKHKIYSENPELVEKLVEDIVFSRSLVRFKIIKEKYQQDGRAVLVVQFYGPGLLYSLIEDKIVTAYEKIISSYDKK